MYMKTMSHGLTAADNIIRKLSSFFCVQCSVHNVLTR